MPLYYRIRCDCGKHLHVTNKHFGHMLHCPACDLRIYVSAQSVAKSGLPPQFMRRAPQRKRSRHYEQREVPLHWKRGDLLMDIYRVLGIRGKGGMGVVYKVHHRGWDMNVAVKSPKPKLVAQRGFLVQFERECETWVNLLSHPNIVKCYYVRRMGGIPRAFVEYIAGSSLRAYIRHKMLYEGDKDESLRRILDISVQVAWGLHHAHEQGLVHQDVKPGNLIIRSDGTAKITDFGLTKPHPGRPSADGPLPHVPTPPGRSGLATRASGGTPLFRSPEQRVRDEVTAKIDMWSWGLSVLTMFCGTQMWERGEDAALGLERYLAEGPVVDEIPRMPSAFSDALGQCFQKDPNDRPASMLALSEIVQSVYRTSRERPIPATCPRRRR